MVATAPEARTDEGEGWLDGFLARRLDQRSIERVKVDILERRSAVGEVVLEDP